MEYPLSEGTYYIDGETLYKSHRHWTAIIYQERNGFRRFVLYRWVRNYKGEWELVVYFTLHVLTWRRLREAMEELLVKHQADNLVWEK